MSLRAQVATILPVRRAERGRLLLCSLIYFLIIGGIIFGRNARDSLFLKNVGLAYLPWMYVLNAVVVVACSSAYAAFVDRMPRARFIAISTALFIAVLAACRVGIALTGPGRPLPPALTFTLLYALAQVIWILSWTQFWTFAGDLFDTREAKRLYPLINLGGLLGMVAAGFGGKPLVARIGTENLLLAWILALAAAAAGIAYVHRLAAHDPRAGKGAKPAGNGLSDKLKDLRESPLLRSLAWITLAQWIVFTLVDYLFNAVARDQYPDKDALTQFFGTFRGWAGVSAFLLQLLVTSRLISWLGVGGTILVHPGFLVGSTIWLTRAFGFLSATACKFGDHVFLYTVQESSYQLLYNPIPLDRRGRLRALIEGTVRPISMGVAGLILVVGAWTLNRTQLSAVAFLISLAWLVAARSIRKAYTGALISNLQSGGLSGAVQDLRQLKDDHAVSVLVGSLESKDTDVVACAADILGRMQAREARPAVEALLQRRDDRTRRAALAALGRMADPAALPAVTALLSDRSARVRADAADAVGRLGDDRGAEALVPLLRDADPGVRGKAAAALILVGGIDGVLRGAETVRAMLDSRSPADRKAAAVMLGTVQTRHFLPALLALLGDSDADVRAAAAKSLGLVADPRALPRLLPLLADRPLQRRVRRAILRIGAADPAAVHEAVASAFRETPEGAPLRAPLLEILTHVPGDAAMPVALDGLDDPSGDIRSRALAAVAASLPHCSSPKGAIDRLVTCAEVEVQTTYENVRASALLGRAFTRDEVGYVLDALRVEKTRCQDRVLEALALLGDGPAIRRVAREIRSDDPRARADALEALENLGDREITRRLLPTLDEQEPEMALETCRRVLGGEDPTSDALLTRLSAYPGVWTRACAAHFAGRQLLPGCRKMVESLLADPDPLVRETALQALAGIDRDAARDAAKQLCRDPSPGVRRSATRLSRGKGLKKEKTMLSTMERLLFLKSVSFFESLDGEDLLELAEITAVRQVAAGDALYEQGGDADSLYVVVRGQVVIQRKAEGKSIDLANVGEREYFGEMSLLDGAPHTTTAVAAVDSVVLALTRDDFRDLVRDRPEAALGVFKEIARRLRLYRDEAHAVGEAPELASAEAPAVTLRG